MPRTPSFDAKAFFQELKSNRRTQAALAAFGAVLVWMIWSLFFDTPGRKPRRAAAGPGAAIDPKAVSNLDRLPHLSALDKAGELPPMPKLLRDPFLFDAPKPPPPPVKYVPPPPPPPKTPEQLAEEQRQRDIAAENNSRPQDLRYIGFLEGSPAGQVGAFMKGEEALPLTLGTLLRERWKLIVLTEKSATFQNTKYPELKCELATREAGAAATTNEY